jgi:hypoxanthine phosphoribosyltransferase
MVAGSLVGRHVLLVTDIVDSGITVDTVARRIARLSPASLRVATLLDRKAHREVDVQIDFCGFAIPDRFVIGYGIDHAGLHRELPDLHSLK